MASDVESSYAHRAAEYIERLGSMTGVHSSDVQLVASWAASIDGPLLDAGCGPGHWTAYLADQGNEVRGLDQVHEFIASARQAYPEVHFETGTVDALADPAETYAGVLAWYSLIHHEPSTIQHALGEFARVLRPGGRLLVGFFVGPRVEPFDHSIVTAYRWSVDALADELSAAGFEAIEAHTRIAFTGTPRPHGAIVAQLRAATDEQDALAVQ